MATGPICQRKPARCLKVPLKSTEQIYLVFLMPILFGCAVYVINFAADFVVAIQHYREGHPFWAIATIALMYAPAFVYFALTVSRPDWWMTEDESIKDGVLAWFAMQILQLLAFPLFALYRYASLIVLAIDATMLNGEERTRTLNMAAAPAAIELYFFLQAWFQAAPQAVFQTHLLFREYTNERTHQTVVVHMLCILMSIVVMSMETASFQRFESQRINGRRLPWATWLKKYREQESGNQDEKKPLQVEMTSSTVRSSVAPLIEAEETSPEGEIGGEREAAVSRQNLERQVSMTPPLPPKNLQVKPPPAPIRGLTSVASLPVPEMPAPPRPDSIVREPEAPASDRRVNIAEAPSDDETARKIRNLRIPQRKYSVKGLDEDDPAGKFVAFVWWFFFIVARVFSVAIFYEFYPMWLLGLLATHYLLMVAYILYNAKYYDVTNFFLTLWLGFVYLFCVIEYRVKFKYADISLLVYYTFVILQNAVITVTWFVLAEWNGFWYTYMFFSIIVSMALCFMSAGVYALLLKPKKRRVYAS
ncbi:uncharacterized protein [Venturia canescens]|uniref:uncharacterized protein n=1 Tax=Venturia canescens TaxID=32260 RepID=UPI001C9BDD83|nr:uncharacterized protein LOC122418417 [Venturia canescens]